MNIKFLFIVFTLLLMSCDNDYSYVLKDPNASKNGYVINMEDHNTKLTIATLSGQHEILFLKKRR